MKFTIKPNKYMLFSQGLLNSLDDIESFSGLHVARALRFPVALGQDKSGRHNDVGAPQGCRADIPMYIYIKMYVYTHVICMYVHIHIYIHVYIYMYMYICVYIYMYVEVYM